MQNLLLGQSYGKMERLRFLINSETIANCNLQVMTNYGKIGDLEQFNCSAITAF